MQESVNNTPTLRLHNRPITRRPWRTSITVTNTSKELTKGSARFKTDKEKLEQLEAEMLNEIAYHEKEIREAIQRVERETERFNRVHGLEKKADSEEPLKVRPVGKAKPASKKAAKAKAKVEKEEGNRERVSSAMEAIKQRLKERAA